MPSSTSTRRRLIAAVVAILVLGGCTLSTEGTAVVASKASNVEAGPVPRISVTQVPPPTPGLETTTPQSSNDLAASFDDAVTAMPPGEVGVAIYDGHQIATFGTWMSGAAWSTIKVPLAIAALRIDPAALLPTMQQAISNSDNAAAEQMWISLGDPHAAAQTVDEVLREGGDSTATVQPNQIYPPYSPYGQTDWSTEQSAIFTFGLPCIAGAEPVLDQMQYLGGNQQWGMAPYAGVAAKGGWGPDPDGRYLVRQIALVTNNFGNFGISLAAKPADGSFESGQAMLDHLGAWIEQHRDAISGGHC